MFIPTKLSHKGIFLLLSLLYLFAVTLASISISKLMEEGIAAKQQETINRELALVRAKIEAAIFMDTYLADSLATVVTIDPTFALENWDNIAEKLLKKAHYVRNVGIAPNNVITHMYPLKGNEKAIGFDFRTHPEQFKTVELARQQQKVYLAGPLELVQGGVALIARYPIFSDYPQNQDYWGGVSVVIDYDKLIHATGLMHIDGADVAMRKLSSSKQDQAAFFGDSEVFEQPDIQYPIKLPNGQWLLAATLHTDNQQILLVRSRIYSISAVTAALLYLLIILLYRNYQYAHRDALHDELTRLPNRRFILTMLKRIARNPKTKSSFSVLNIDVNGFKQINDQLGHETGDELLIFIAKQLRACLRSTDTVARFGGDEFIVLLEGLNNSQQVELLINKIHHHFADQHLYFSEQRIQASLSIGYAIFDDEDMSIKQLLADADRSMYKSKQAFKQQYQPLTPNEDHYT